MKNVTIKAVDTTEELEGFHCGIGVMDSFIHDGLELSLAYHFCQLYKVLIEEEIVALFALSFDSVDLDEDDKEEMILGVSPTGTPDVTVDYKETFYGKRRYPALDIAYFAVREDMRGLHLGTFLISEIKKKAREQKFAGCQFITVDAYKTSSYSAVGFYDKCGFAPNEYPNPNKDTLRMFCTLYSK